MVSKNWRGWPRRGLLLILVLITGLLWFNLATERAKATHYDEDVYHLEIDGEGCEWRKESDDTRWFECENATIYQEDVFEREGGGFVTILDLNWGAIDDEIDRRVADRLNCDAPTGNDIDRCVNLQRLHSQDVLGELLAEDWTPFGKSLELYPEGPSVTFCASLWLGENNEVAGLSEYLRFFEFVPPASGDTGFSYLSSGCNPNLDYLTVSIVCTKPESFDPYYAGDCYLFGRDRTADEQPTELDPSNGTSISGPTPGEEAEATRVETAPVGLADSVSEGCGDTSRLNWAFCGMLWGISNGIEVIERQIYRELRVDRSDYQPDSKDCDPNLGDKRDRACNYYDAWKNMRNLMTLAVVGTAILMVIATALDFGWFSNYTVKKYLARLIAGVVLMIMSWAIGDLVISFANSLGGFAGSAITAPFGGEGGAAGVGLESIFSEFETGAYTAGGAAVVGVGVAAGIVALTGGLSVVPVLLTAALGLLAIVTGFLFLIFRQVVIIALLVFAPVGVALWFLPGSDRMWKLYYKTFLSLVFIYPIIVAVIAFGRVFIWVLLQSDEGYKEPLVVTTAFLIYVGMFMAIPVLFKKFLGAVNQITGGQNNPAKGLFDRLKNARKGYLDQAKAVRKAGKDQSDDEHLAKMRDLEQKAKKAGLAPDAHMSGTDKLRTKAIAAKRRARRGLPMTSSRFTTRPSTRNMSELITAAEEGKRYGEAVNQWADNGLDTKFNLDASDHPSYMASFEAIARGEDPTGQDLDVSLAEAEGALRVLAKNKEQNAFRRLNAEKPGNSNLNQAWNNLIRDGTTYKAFEKVAMDVAKNQIEPSDFDISGMADEILQTQTHETVGQMELSYDRILLDAASSSPSSGASYEKLDKFSNQIERLLDNKFARNRMPPGTYEALEQIKTKHDQTIEANVNHRISTFTPAHTTRAGLSAMAGNVDQTLAAEVQRQAAIKVAATSGHEDIVRNVYASTDPVTQSSFKAALRAETLKGVAAPGGRSVADLAPHIANLEIDDDGNVGKLEDVNWLKLGLTQPQLGNLSHTSAADMEKWFSDNLPKARADTVFRRDMKNYSSTYIDSAVGRVRPSDPALADILERIHDSVDKL